MDSVEAQRLAVLIAIRDHPNQTIEQLATHTGIDRNDVDNCGRWLQFRYLVGINQKPGKLASHHLTVSGRATLDLLGSLELARLGMAQLVNAGGDHG